MMFNQILITVVIVAVFIFIHIPYDQAGVPEVSGYGGETGTRQRISDWGAMGGMLMAPYPY